MLSKATATKNSIRGICVLVGALDTADPNKIDIYFNSFPRAQILKSIAINGDNALYTNGVREPIKLQVDIEGNLITVTLSLISDPSKSFTTTYTYTGAYDLTAGQVGLRGNLNDCSFDNFQVNDTIYTFDDEASVEGMNFYHSGFVNGIRTTVANTLVLRNTETFTSGTLAATVNTAGKHKAGLVFGADATGENYHLLRMEGDNTIDLVKVENGVETVLDTSYLTGTHNYAKDHRLEIITDGNTAYCYYYTEYDKINCYAVNEVELAGDRYGFWADTSGTVFSDVTITDATEKRTAETLIFGHSFTEMWWDSETYFPEYTDIDNIGVGGAWTVTWERLTDEVISYEPKLGIFNIGINDLNNGQTPATVVNGIESVLLTIKDALPDFKVALVSVGHCPARANRIDVISEANVLMREMAAKYDWVYYVDVEYLFCSDPTDPTSTIASYCLSDGLHPSEAGYKLMAEAIRNTINSVDETDDLVNHDYKGITGSFTANSLNGFTVDGKLTPDASGEGKVILRDTPADVKTVSVELHPNGSIASGIYLSASKATATKNSIRGICVLIGALNSADPNRIDLYFSKFPGAISLGTIAINGENALYTNGVREPIKLQVEIEGNQIIVTISLISDPSKSFTTTYTYTGAYDLTADQVGLRSNMNSCAFDNFQVNNEIYTFDNEDSVKCMNFYHSGCVNGIQATASNTLVLHNTDTFTNGTLAATVNTAGKNKAGLVFGADATGENYHLFRIDGDNTIDLVKVENGVETVLETSYLTATHNYAKDYRLEIVKDGNTVYCYYYSVYDKISCYVVKEVELAGNRFGFCAAASGAVFNDVTITDATENRTAETLLFGTSNMEMWWDYETYFPEYTSIDNIGVGGSTTATWERLTDEVISYGPKLGIYSIGINDLVRAISPTTLVNTMESTLLTIKDELPDFKVVLVSLSHTPNCANYIDAISETNVLMRAMAEKYDWVYVADTEYLYCSDPADPSSAIASYFTDGLNPSAAGYQLLAEAIRNAINEEN